MCSVPLRSCHAQPLGRVPEQRDQMLEPAVRLGTPICNLGRPPPASRHESAWMANKKTALTGTSGMSSPQVLSTTPRHDTPHPKKNSSRLRSCQSACNHNKRPRCLLSFRHMAARFLRKCCIIATIQLRTHRHRWRTDGWPSPRWISARKSAARRCIVFTMPRKPP
jgi:hypothetical protein